jgi:hypothetical protein
LHGVVTLALDGNGKLEIETNGSQRSSQVIQHPTIEDLERNLHEASTVKKLTSGTPGWFNCLFDCQFEVFTATPGILSCDRHLAKFVFFFAIISHVILYRTSIRLSTIFFWFHTSSSAYLCSA